MWVAIAVAIVIFASVAVFVSIRNGQMKTVDGLVYENSGPPALYSTTQGLTVDQALAKCKSDPNCSLGLFDKRTNNLYMYQTPANVSNITFNTGNGQQVLYYKPSKIPAALLVPDKAPPGYEIAKTVDGRPLVYDVRGQAPLYRGGSALNKSISEAVDQCRSDPNCAIVSRNVGMNVAEFYGVQPDSASASRWHPGDGNFRVYVKPNVLLPPSI